MPLPPLPRIPRIALIFALYWLVLLVSYVKTPELLISARLAFGILLFAGLPLAAIAGSVLWRSAHAQASKAALEDELTGLGSRRAFSSQFIARLERATPGSITLLLLDVDNLKGVNDGCGHQAGDELLAHAGLFLRQLSREAYRIGGDEFALVLDRRHGDRVTQTLQRVQAFEHRFHACGHTHRIQFARGFATKQASDTFEEIFRRADEHLRKSKTQAQAAAESTRLPRLEVARVSLEPDEVGPEAEAWPALPDGVVSLAAKRRQVVRNSQQDPPANEEGPERDESPAGTGPV